jgi:hypothetical protein
MAEEGREKRFRVGSTNESRKNKKATKKATWEQSWAPSMEKISENRHRQSTANPRQLRTWNKTITTTVHPMINMWTAVSTQQPTYNANSKQQPPTVTPDH